MWHLFVSTLAAPATNAIIPILYIWSAMLSGSETSLRTHPVRLVVCAIISPCLLKTLVYLGHS